MKQQQSVKKNFIYSTLYQILLVITPLITAPYLARVLEADGTGIQSFTSSVQSYFILFAALGTASYGAREISRNRNDKKVYSKIFWEIELMTVLTSGVSIVLWLAWCLIANDYKVIYFVMIWNLFATMFDISWFFTGLEQFRFIVLRNSFFKVLGIVLMFVVVKTKQDLILYILILALTNLCSSLSTWTYLPKFLVKINWKELSIREHFKETLIYFIPTIATSIYTVLDKTLLQVITHDESQNGYYAQAEKVINLAKSIVFTALNSVIGVRISFLFAENKIEEIKKKIETSLHYIFFMGVGCVCGISGVASNFVPCFFGKGYEPVIPLLYILSPIILIIGISNCLGAQYYTPSGRRAQSAKYLICGSIVNLGLNLLLIPKYASYGAAIASILAELTITILYVCNSNGFVDFKLLVKTAGKKVISGIIMLFVLLQLFRILKFDNIINLAIQMVIGVVIYFTVLILIKDSWTIDMIRNLCKSVSSFICPSKKNS